LRGAALNLVSKYKLGPVFTPPIIAGVDGKRGLLMVPANIGGANWPGAAVDPETGVLYVASVTSQTLVSLVPTDPKESTTKYIGSLSRLSGEDAKVPIGTPPPSVYGAFGPQGLPLMKPPYGRITAIDLNTGEHQWMIPNGDTPEYILSHPALKGIQIPKTGRPSHSGILVTKTLMFAGEGSGLLGAPPGAGGPMFRAYDKRTGETVSEFRLPANQTGVPMTYLVDGRQYIVVAVGSKEFPAELVALTVRE
jgi:quinoprotein glucose dehydrogenase